MQILLRCQCRRINFNDAQALSHFQNYGLNEGRTFSPFVNLKFTWKQLLDLANFNNQQSVLPSTKLRCGRRTSFFQFVTLIPTGVKVVNADLAILNNEQIFVCKTMVLLRAPIPQLSRYWLLPTILVTAGLEVLGNY